VSRRIPIVNAHFYWEKFIKNGELSEEELRPLVADSWRRCFELGVDPHDGRSHHILQANELRRTLKKSEDLISIALPFMQDLYSYVAGSGFLVILTDDRGCILEVLGDSEALQEADKINFVRGAFWTEEQVGTNAIGTALVEKKPVQIDSCEHYCESHHVWTCSAAPIFNETGNISGVLNMSGPSQETHKHTLGMVVSSVTAITYQMRVSIQNRKLDTINRQMQDIFNTISDGIMIIDAAGNINRINPVAEMLLGTDNREAKGLPGEGFFANASFLQETLQNGMEHSLLETPLKGSTGIINCIVSINPILNDFGQVNGALVFFNPVKKFRSLFNHITGAHASFNFHDIIGQDPALQKAIQTASLAADKRSNILLQGESGTGKELFAQAIHNASPRGNGPFIAVNCGAIPRELLGSELFGYVEGAFTGARKGGRTGKFELASGGTLFLDEIAEMPLGKQVSLLRAVQEKKITRIGDDKVIPVDVRIICATNKDLKAEVEKGNFRQDLYYRLNVISIKLPPLRDRREDIPLQFNFLLKESCEKMNMGVPHVQPDVMYYLNKYDWPGNVRELQNVVERMLNISNGEEITTGHLPTEILQYEPKDNITTLVNESALSVDNRRERKKQLKARREKQQIVELLDKYGGNITRVAEEMEVARNTVYRKMRQYGIE